MFFFQGGREGGGREFKVIFIFIGKSGREKVGVIFEGGGEAGLFYVFV